MKKFSEILKFSDASLENHFKKEVFIITVSITPSVQSTADIQKSRNLFFLTTAKREKKNSRWRKKERLWNFFLHLAFGVLLTLGCKQYEIACHHLLARVTR
jgi:hypothetical protein